MIYEERKKYIKLTIVLLILLTFIRVTNTENEAVFSSKISVFYSIFIIAFGRK